MACHCECTCAILDIDECATGSGGCDQNYLHQEQWLNGSSLCSCEIGSCEIVEKIIKVVMVS